MDATTREHSEPLLHAARDGSLDVEGGSNQEKKYSPARFYESRPFLVVSVLWFTGSLLFFASALLLRNQSRGEMDAIYCKLTGQDMTPIIHADSSDQAPVQAHVRHKTVVFDPSLRGKKTIYMEDPSPRVDKAWEDLYGESNFFHCNLLANLTEKILACRGLPLRKHPSSPTRHPAFLQTPRIMSPDWRYFTNFTA